MAHPTSAVACLRGLAGRHSQAQLAFAEKLSAVGATLQGVVTQWSQDQLDKRMAKDCDWMR